jgi:hypothetical protein
MGRDGGREESQRRGFRNVLLLLAGLLTFGSAGLPWAVAESGETAVTDADVREFALTLAGDPMQGGETTASLAGASGAGAGVVRDLGTNSGRSTVRIGGAYVNLEPPAGHCFLDETQPRDQQLASVLRAGFRSGELRLAGAFADCAQLETWRRGGRAGFDHYGMLLIPAGFIDKTLDGAAGQHVGTICRILRKKAGGNAGDISARRRPIETALRGAEPGEIRFLGIVGEDERACYAGFVQQREGATGGAKLLLDVAAISFVSGKMIYSHLYAVHEGDQTLHQLLARQRQAVERSAR